MRAKPARVAILISGTGSNMDAILRARDGINADFVGVISSKPGVEGLHKAEAHGVPTAVIDASAFAVRRDFDDAVADQLEAWGAELIVLAGFMRILGADFVRRFENRVINVHPSLLPLYRGGTAVEDALADGAKETGCTIHVVVEDVDAGPVIIQRPVPIEAGDTRDTLHRRIQAVEHELYPEAVQRICAGEIHLDSLGDDQPGVTALAGTPSG